MNVVFCNVNPAGKVSSTRTPVSATGLLAGLASVRISAVLPPVPIEAGLKLLATVGGVRTVNVAVAAVPVPALVVVTVPVLLR